MANTYKCPKCGANNKVLTFTEKLGENIPSTIFGAAVTAVLSAVSLGLGAVVGVAFAAYQWANGYTVTCYNCRHTFHVDG